LLSGQRDTVNDICIVTWRAQRFFESLQGACFYSGFPTHFSLNDFRELKSDVVEVREGHGVDVSTCLVNEVEVEEAQEKLRRNI
jgi:hypothetical protein